MNFTDLFCRDNYGDEQEFVEFTVTTVIPKDKKELVINWTNMYQLHGVVFHEVDDGYEFEVQGDFLEEREESFDELMEDLYSVVEGKKEIQYIIRDPSRPTVSWDGVYYPKGGHFEYSKGGVEYLL